MTAALAQREAALAKANRTRLTNAARCRRIAALSPAEGMELAAETLDDPDRYARMELRLLLCAIHRFGNSRMLVLLGDLGIPPSMMTRPLATRSSKGREPLTASQRQRIARRLREWAANGGHRT